jgi:hypothetical protein
LVQFGDLPAINSRRLDLLDHPRLLAQIASLERRTARGGRDSIDHAPGGHDDLANAVAGVSAACAKGNFDLDLYTRMDWVMGPDLASPAPEASPWRSPSWK